MDLLKQHAFQIDLSTSQVSVAPPPLACSSLGLTALPKLLLTADEEDRLQDFLAAELPGFESIEGTTPLIYHHINLTQSEPIKQRYQPRNPKMQEMINTEVDRMLEEGVIEPSMSPWSSPVVIVKKKGWQALVLYRFSESELWVSSGYVPLAVHQRITRQAA